MPEPIKIEEVKERVILVGVSEQDGDDAEDSVAELAELVKTAGAVTVGTLIQKRELIHPGTYVGTGKVQEIADMIAELGATGIVCDDELSPAQLKNLEQMLDTKVMDRTLIILDIFAARATTSEARGIWRRPMNCRSFRMKCASGTSCVSGCARIFGRLRRRVWLAICR